MYNKDTIYDIVKHEQEKERKYNREYEEIFREPRKNHNYLKENELKTNTLNERKSMESKRNVKHKKISGFEKTIRAINAKKDLIKRVLKTGSAIALIGIGTKAIIGKIEEYKYQKNIDNSISEDYEDFYYNLADESKDKITDSTYEMDKQSFSNYLAALEIMKKYGNEEINYNSDLYEEVEDAKTIIEDYTKNGKIIKIACNTIEAKIDNAKKYGDYEYSIYDETQINYIDTVEDNIKGFQVNGIDGETYYLKGATILDNNIPGNLHDLTEDIFEYRQKDGKWKNSEECIEFGMEVGENIGKVLQEYYILDENGSLLRINEKDFKERKQQVDKDAQIKHEIFENETMYEIIDDIILDR